MQGEQTNIPCERIIKALYRYSALEELELNSFECRVGIVTSFQRLSCGKGEERKALQWKHLSQVPQGDSDSEEMCGWCEPLMPCDGNGSLLL